VPEPEETPVGALEGEVPEIDVAELAARLDAGAALVDVREPDEYNEAHVPGAQLIPLSTVPDQIDALPVDRPLYVICAKGGRSHRAAEFYRSRGIDAINVAGGTGAWIEAGRPTAEGMEP
jgi:rhodanese-related sulfurtransferase